MIFLSACLVVLSACAPKMSTNISHRYAPLDYREEVQVLEIDDPDPNDFEVLGTVKLGDTGFSVDCGREEVIDKAKMEARKVGGNGIKIIKHTLPDFASSCHRITANIIKVSNWDNYQTEEEPDSALINADYALLHVYRPSGTGALINYDLHLENEMICRVSNKWKKSIKITKEGRQILWARTESKTELPLNIQFGHEYYVRCGLTMGFFIGRPKLEEINNRTGKREFQAIKQKSSKNKNK